MAAAATAATPAPTAAPAVAASAVPAAAAPAVDATKADADAKAAALAKEKRKARKKNRNKAKRAAAAATAAADDGDDDDADADADAADGDDADSAEAKAARAARQAAAKADPVKLLPQPAKAVFIAPPTLGTTTAVQRNEWLLVQPVPGKGKGCIAAKDIPAGTVILTEAGLHSDFFEARGAADAAAVLAASLIERDDCNDLYFENDAAKGGIKLYRAPADAAAKGMTDARWSMAMAQVTTNCFVMKLRDGDGQLNEADQKAADVAAESKAAGAAEAKSKGKKKKKTKSASAAAADGDAKGGDAPDGVTIAADGTTTKVETVGDVVRTTVVPPVPTTHRPDSRLLLFPFASRFNHSCWPNAHMIRRGGASVVYALDDIKAGTEVCICYRDEFLWLPSKRRAVMLKLSHMFVCACVRCAPAPGAVSPCAKFEHTLELTNPMPLSFADRELMETQFTEAEKVHNAYSTLEDVHQGVEQWNDWLQTYGHATKKLHLCHWKMFAARRYLIEALQTAAANDVGGGLSSKHRKLLASVLQEQLECLEVVVPTHHNIKVIYFKTLLACSNKARLPTKALDDAYAKLKKFWGLA